MPAPPTLALAKQIGERGDLTVVTNDFVIAAYLLENSQCELIHTGGTVCRENRSCVGEAAAQALRQLFIDLAFISASSWSMRGLSTPSEDKVAVKKAIVDASRRRILLSDTSKYGKVATYLALPIAVFDAIITDSYLPDAAQTAIQQANITLHMTGE
ncbi:HTH-type transcriptional repressor glcR [Serratia rubidaea]|uniref:HTH-type transcriptional repressor glcR n=1 Tax=Serratia rubidaea TaxID=61652 RepID=A0A4U9HBR7_SERRU|nr:HTH-type transcriptional repressor glcR [Serratia rubidaea]